MMRFVVFGWLAAAVVLAACSKKTGPSQTENTQEVNYETLWQTIDSLDGQQLYRSAQEEVINLAAAAKADGESQQWIKSQIYLTKYAYMLNEDDLANAIEEIEMAIAKSEGVETAILRSLAGELYHAYFRTNSAKLRGRSETGVSDSSDIRTWSARDLILRTSDMYFSSVEDPEALKQPVSEYALLLTDGNTQELRPTLYDILAHRAFDYFSQNLWTLTSFYPDEEFLDPDYLQPYDTFVNVAIEVPSAHYYKHRALRVIQDLIRFHMNDDDPQSLVHADLVRLSFAKQFLNSESSDILYRDALEHCQDFAEGTRARAEVAYYLAEWYLNYGREEKDGFESERDPWVIADSICDVAISTFPESYGAARCLSLKNRLHQKSISIRTENVWLPGEHMLVNVNYRNIDKIYVKIFKLVQEDLMGLYQGGINRGHWNTIIARAPEFETAFELTGTGDLREHSTEIILPPQDLGPHAIAIYDHEDEDSARIVATVTHVSRIGFWDETLPAATEKSDYFVEGPDDPRLSRFVVVDRETGVPTQGALVEAYSYVYSPDVRRQLLTYMSRDKTDENGVVENLNVRGSRSIIPKITLGDDVLFLNDSYRTYGMAPKSRPARKVSFFTDRAIYRPGQMLHFKGYAVEYDGERLPSILAGEKYDVKLRDVNGSEVGSMEVVSNEYGTFSGVFRLPESGLTGRMTLIVPNEGRTTIRVEEYKRPTFEVELDPPTGLPSLGDIVLMEGKASTYSGVPVSNANVKYSVYKRIIMPMYGWYSQDLSWRISDGIAQRGVRKLIHTGSASTNEKGQFNIEFTADSNQDKESKYPPTYLFEVVAEVTDQAGESQEAKEGIRLNDNGFIFTIEGQSTRDLEEINGFKVNAESNNGEPVSGSLFVKVEKLRVPERLFRNRFWTEPDQWLYTAEEFSALVPDYAYEDQSGFTNYPVMGSVGEVTGQVTDGDSIELSSAIGEAGAYKLGVSFTSSNDKTIEFDYYVIVNDVTNGEYGLRKPLHVELAPPLVGVPGDTIDLTFNAEENVIIRHTVNRWQGEQVNLYSATPGEQVNAPIPIEESDRGGLSISYSTVYNSRYYGGFSRINVPWENKILDVQLTSWRDKTMPGSEEEWEMTIKGLDSDQQAEMLATMYDKSLDAFVSNEWSARAVASFPFFNFTPRVGPTPAFLSSNQQFQYFGQRELQQVQLPTRVFSRLNWFGLNLETTVYLRGMALRNEAVDMAAPSADVPQDMPTAKTQPEEVSDRSVEIEKPEVNVRENLEETVFFFPHQVTGQDGTLTVRFKMNEALTRWKFMGLVHTRDLKLGYCEAEVTTSLPLMVTPHVPRFLRQDDDGEVTARIFNNTDSVIAGAASIELYNSVTDEDLIGELVSTSHDLNFTLKPGESTVRSWKLRVPGDMIDPIRYRVVAATGQLGDGEEGLIPVLTNRMFITETQALFIGSGRNERIEVDALKIERQASFEPVQFSLEMSSNPAWYAVQALPYLNDYPHQCVEQQFNRYYANKIAAMIGSNSNIRDVLRQMAGDPDTQPLTGRDDLKSISIEDTPWLRAAQSDEERLNDLIEFLDVESVKYNIDNDLRKLLQAQMSNGGFPWFPGGRDNWYITQYLVEGVGHLRKLGAFETGLDPEVRAAIVSAISYMDARLVESYEQILRAQKVDNPNEVQGDHYSSLIAHYFYARSFFNDIVSEDNNAREAAMFFMDQAKAHWTNKPLYVQVLTASAFHQMNVNTEMVSVMQQSFEERSITDGDRGRFWKANNGWYWYEAPLERHAAMIEFFIDRNAEQDFIDELRLYLLTNKRTNQWSTTKSTSAAIYALILGGDDWLSGDQVAVSADGTAINFNDASAGTLYTRKDWEGEAISDVPNELTFTNPNDHAAWGATYLQYFEDIDNVIPDEGNELRIRKQLFVEAFDGTDRILEPVESGTELKKGDNLITRLTIETDRDMEFVHIKDMRAAGFEPVNVLSNYKWKAGLGYYESTRDVATDFFVDKLRRGLYVFEYPLRVSHSGTYSSGIATIQSMYAPEYAAHSESLEVRVQ